MGRGLGVALLVLAATATSFVSRPAEAATGREDHMRAEIAQLLNGERANRGLDQLPVDAGLSQSAQEWAEHVQSSGCMPPADCHSPGAQGEILAWGGPDSKTGAIVVAWMRSTTHRDILLHPKADSLGVGFACSENGTVFTAVQFGGVYQPVTPMNENPIANSTTAGTACVGHAAYLAQTAPPSTTAPRPERAGAAPTTTTRPTTRQTVAAPIVVRRTPAPSTTAVTAEVPETSPSPPTTIEPSVVLSAQSPGVPAEVDQVALAEVALPPPHKAESSWLFMIVVVVFLSVLRVGFQLRDIAGARAKERAGASGL